VQVGFVPASASSAAPAVAERDPKNIITVLLCNGSPCAGLYSDHCCRVSQDAVDVGYRYFDCAEFYGNEAMVGEALKSTSVPRKDFYLVSRMNDQSHLCDLTCCGRYPSAGPRPSMAGQQLSASKWSRHSKTCKQTTLISTSSTGLCLASILRWAALGFVTIPFALNPRGDG
jgi:uncharacterized protein (DUF2237 family)